MCLVKNFLVLIVSVLMQSVVIAQVLQPGFNKAEYIEMIKISAKFGDSTYRTQLPPPEHSNFIYRSPVMGLENRWDLWMTNGNTAVISLRGTTASSVSWLNNFYAAMIPAKGSLHLDDSTIFNYNLADDPKAAVHVGWMISVAFLSRDILPKIDSCYKAGIKNVIITGHSQGGAIAYLLTAYLYSLQRQQTLPADIRFKTYCSAGPKPGNLYFAYAYEAITQQGWAYNVVNAADWVPETPFSIQTLQDLNKTNPFVNAKQLLKKQPFPKDIVLRYAYNRLEKPSRQAQRNYEKYLGKYVAKQVQKHLKGFKPPAYYHSTDYVRTGNYIVLLPDAEYYKLYPDSEKKIFTHHYHMPYLYLAMKLP